MGARKLLVLHHMDVGEARLTKIIVSMTPFTSSGFCVDRRQISLRRGLGELLGNPLRNKRDDFCLLAVIDGENSEDVFGSVGRQM